MRRKRNGRRDVLIDLTSLLDVIFIILMVVLFAQQGLNHDLGEQQALAADAQLEAEAEMELYEDMIDTADNIGQYVCAISVSVPYSKAQITRREIKLLEGGREIQSFELNGLDTQDAMASFEKRLLEYIDGNSERPVILSLNDGSDRILYRDEKSIMALFDKLCGQYDNVYIKNALSGE